ncbi:MAG: XRE family transcriptional regulator [Clostridia bacterium]|nr:XRE family transcriptional regulator [Clostridia bacterium]
MINSQKIKDRLSDMSMTQKELALVIGIAQPTMNQKINNIRPMTLEEAENVARALNISDDDLGVYFFAGELRSATL